MQKKISIYIIIILGIYSNKRNRLQCCRSNARTRRGNAGILRAVGKLDGYSRPRRVFYMHREQFRKVQGNYDW